MGSNPIQTTRFVGVTANPPAGGSICCYEFPACRQAGILIRTAEVYAAYALIPTVPWGLMLLIVPGGVTVNISHFDCDVLSSNLSLVTKHVGFSLSVKRPSVQRRNRVRIPKSTCDDL